MNQIDIYIFSRLCNGWWSDSYGKGQDSSADKSKASKAPKEDDGVWPVCLQGGFGYYFVPLVQYFESLHWDRFFAHKGYPGWFLFPIWLYGFSFIQSDYTQVIQTSMFIKIPIKKLEKMVQRQIWEGLLKVALFIQISMPCCRQTWQLCTVSDGKLTWGQESWGGVGWINRRPILSKVLAAYLVMIW